MQPIERNPAFSNPLIHSASLYLRQHAHNPVFWYPWCDEAVAKAREQNKPIFLSIGYSSCYWCHVMEREVFENVSIAALMNEHFINIKVDREEHPDIDEVYMVARQLMTHQGGWPNNVFLTPDLKPFYSGGTFFAAESQGKASFPQLLEWLHHVWATQEADARQTADNVIQGMQEFLCWRPPADAAKVDIGAQAQRLFAQLSDVYDESSGGFFQAPKFPQENYLQFLLAYHEATGEKRALDIVSFSLQRMAAGGIYDQVAGGFHRYAVDKEWYIPHFEKMLYTQALLARTYAEAARITSNAYFADMAKSVLDFVGGPMTDGSGGFYSAIDAETDGVEGAYYAWTPEDIEALLAPDEQAMLGSLYALADIPQFPGHKHTPGKVLIARRPLDSAARERNMSYLQMSAMAGGVLNKLLAARNLRKAPMLDAKIIVSWNGLMIDAYAHAGRALNQPRYIAIAKKAADFLLNNAIDNEGRLYRIIAGGQRYLHATLEDYAYLTKGLLSLVRAQPDEALLAQAITLMERAKERFFDSEAGGYFYTEENAAVPLRVKSGDDGALPNANAVMADNCAELFMLTGEEKWREQALALAHFFLDGNTRPIAEYASMLRAALRLGEIKMPAPPAFDERRALEQDQFQPVQVFAALFPANAGPGEDCQLIITLDIKPGWHINAARVEWPALIPTQLDVQGEAVEKSQIVYPEAARKTAGGRELAVYEGIISLKAELTLAASGKERGPIKIRIRFQPCDEAACHEVRDISLHI